MIPKSAMKACKVLELVTAKGKRRDAKRAAALRELLITSTTSKVRLPTPDAGLAVDVVTACRKNPLPTPLAVGIRIRALDGMGIATPPVPVARSRSCRALTFRGAAGAAPSPH